MTTKATAVVDDETDVEQPALFELTTRKAAKLMTVEVAAIDIPGIEGFDRQEIAELADTIRRLTLIHAPILQHAGRTRYTPIVGKRRCAALQLLAATDSQYRLVELYVRPDAVSAADAAKLVLAENASRSANVLAELDAINTLLADSKMTPAGVARSVGQREHWVQDRLVLNALQPKLLKLMTIGRLRFTTAQALARCDRPTQAAVWTRYVEKKKQDDTAVVSGADITEASARAPVPLPQALFAPLPDPDDQTPPISRAAVASSAAIAALEVLREWATDEAPLAPSGYADPRVIVAEAAIPRLALLGKIAAMIERLQQVPV